jgi:hypothetical protein
VERGEFHVYINNLRSRIPGTNLCSFVLFAIAHCHQAHGGVHEQIMEDHINSVNGMLSDVID